MIVNWIKPTAVQNRHIRFLLTAWIVILSGFAAIPAVAQLERFPIPRQSRNQDQQTRDVSGARTKQLIPKALPFWDDFSFTPVNVNSPESNYPVDSLWINNKTVWINDGLAIDPPSYNVATFDGLDSAFQPYSDQVLTNGLRDSLVSQAIKLGEPGVTIAERDGVYLSFYYQWQGNGEAPDPLDFIEVEFKSNLGIWESVMKIFPKTSFERTLFYDTLVKVDGERFFHDLFQFRFRNFGRLSGPYDTWNIDHVYLNKNRTIADTDFPDQAISTPMTGLFASYQAIPYHHLPNGATIGPPVFRVSNNLDEFTDLTYLTEATFINYKGGNAFETFVPNLGGTDTSAINDDGSGIIFPLEKRTVTLEYLPVANDASQFDPDADSVRVSLKVKLFTGDTFDPKTGGYANDYSLNYKPIDFRCNDTLRATYFLKDYYAYDDGVAEYAAGLTQPGNRAAVSFDMFSFIPDTLVGIDIYVPDYGLTSNLTSDFYVYSDASGKPGALLYTIPSYAVKRLGLNKFQRIRILEPFLVEDKFYIGWKAPVGPPLKIGLDVNNNSGDKIFVNTNGTWTENMAVEGSLMIRPVFGTGEIVTGVENERLDVSIFPNPNPGTFYVSGDFDSVELISVTGQLVPARTEQLEDRIQITLIYPAPGFYLLKLRKGETVTTEKVIVK
jgi:hypothetical protein